MSNSSPGLIQGRQHDETAVTDSLLDAWATSAAPAYCRDLHGRVLAANSAFTRKFGRALLVSERDSVVRLIHPDDAGSFALAEAELRESPFQVTRADRWLTPQGWRWMNWEETVMFDGKGLPMAVRAIGHDITRQRLTEELYLKLSRAVEQSPVAIAITDADGRVQYVNPKFTQVSGHTLEEILENGIQILREGHASEESYQRFLATVRTGSDWQGELTHVRPNGPKIWESVQVSCLRNGSGDVTNLLCLREDITERKHLEDELRQSQKMESLGTLAGGIAHDFNNLLAVINGYVELSLLHPNNQALLQKSLNEIKRASQRAIGLVRQILTFSRKAEVRFGPMDLNQLVSDLCNLLAETFPRTVTFNISLHEGLPPLLADQNQLQQVVLNLCVNARDAMPTGGTISISTSIVPGRNLSYANTSKDQNYACLQVADTGMGMTPEVRARIFEPFYTTKQGNKGTGLGLAVVYGIVASHQGHIEVDSSPGNGSVFRVLMPLAEAAVIAPSPIALKQFPGGTESLLVVDDEDPLRNILHAAFSSKGYKVTDASDGLKAIDVINDPGRPIDAVLLDLNMPGVSGVDVLRTIRAARPRLPVLILSGHITAETRAILEQMGQKDFVTKPCELDEIGRRIRQLLESKTAA
jgi:two-component system cell cycle sensor histidine kinase/response regulator CckA